MCVQFPDYRYLWKKERKWICILYYLKKRIILFAKYIYIRIFFLDVCHNKIDSKHTSRTAQSNYHSNILILHLRQKC